MIKNIFKNKYRLGIIFIFVFIIFDYSKFLVNPHNSIFVSTVKKYYFEKILQNTQEYYKLYDVALETDEIIMLNWLWPETVNDIEIKSLKDPFFRLQNKEFKIEKHEIDEESKEILTDPTDEILFRAMLCDKNGYNNKDYELLKNIADEVGGYGDTHFLIGLLLIESLDCIENVKIENDMNNVIENIMNAQKNDESFSDLFSERVVVLYWAGKKENIKYNWIEKIASHQQTNGGWIESGMQEPDPHVTGLSALAIKYFIENEVEDIWFVK